MDDKAEKKIPTLLCVAHFALEFWVSFCLPSGCQVFFSVFWPSFCLFFARLKKRSNCFCVWGFILFFYKNISDSFWLIGIYFFVNATQFYTQCSPSLTYCLFGHFLGQLSWQYFCKNGKLWPHLCQLLSMLSFYLNVTFFWGHIFVKFVHFSALFLVHVWSYFCQFKSFWQNDIFVIFLYSSNQFFWSISTMFFFFLLLHPPHLFFGVKVTQIFTLVIKR